MSKVAHPIEELNHLLLTIGIRGVYTTATRTAIPPPAMLASLIMNQSWRLRGLSVLRVMQRL